MTKLAFEDTVMDYIRALYNVLFAYPAELITFILFVATITLTAFRDSEPRFCGLAEQDKFQGV